MQLWLNTLYHIQTELDWERMPNKKDLQGKGLHFGWVELNKEMYTDIFCLRLI